MKYLILPLLLLTGCATAKLNPWPVHECEDIPGVDGASYCYDESATGATDVLWFFHGLKDTKEVWRKPTIVPSSYPELINSMPPMRIVTVSWVGSVADGWMLAKSRTQKPYTATLEVFKNKVVPYIEQRRGLKGPYKLMGHSMGGSNAATLAAAYPEMWSSVTLINPALIVDANDPWEWEQKCPWCLEIKQNFDNLDQWKAERPRPSPVLTHITGCKQDVLFSLYDGTVEFKNKSVNVDWHDGLPGCDHWHFDVPWVVEGLR